MESIKIISCYVAGRPRPKGSWRGIPTDAGGVAFKASSKGVHPWQQAIGWAVTAELRKPVHARWYKPGLVCDGRVGVTARFLLPPGADADLDKLIRAVLDALTGVVYDDDKRVTHIEAHKDTAADVAPGLWLTIAIDERKLVPGSGESQRHTSPPGGRGRGRRTPIASDQRHP